MSGNASGIPRLGTAMGQKSPRTSGIPRMTTPCSRIPTTRKVLGSVNEINSQVSDGDSMYVETKEDKIMSQCVDMAKKRTSEKIEDANSDTDQSFRVGNPNKSEVIITKGMPTRLVPKAKKDEEMIMKSNSQESIVEVSNLKEMSRCDRKESCSTFKNPAENQGACGKENCDTQDRTSKTIMDCVMKDRTSKSSFILHLPAEDQETLEKILKVRHNSCVDLSYHAPIIPDSIIYSVSNNILKHNSS